MKCICCNNNNFEYLWTNLEKESLRHKWQPLDVHICRDCGMVSLDITELTESQLDEYYTTSNTFELPTALPEGHKDMRCNQVGWVLNSLPKNHNVNSVLDVGCGAGYALKLFKDKGFDVMGIDWSPAMIRNLRNRYNIDGIQGSFTAEEIGVKVDLITSIAVLEHLYDPSNTLDEMKKSLNSNGFLFIEVPDAEFPLDDVIVDHLAFDHLWHWTENTLGRLMENAGFEVIAVKHLKYGPNSGNPESVVRILAQLKSNKLNRKYTASDYAKSRENLTAYRISHKSYLKEFQSRIDIIASKIKGEPVAIFCGGEHTATLFKRFNLVDLNIKYIFDNDPAVVGKSLNGIECREGKEAPVPEIKHYLMSTTNHEKTIHDTLKKSDPDCNVYGLYQDWDN